MLHSAGCGLTLKHETRLERPTRDKYYSLLVTIVNYGLKKIYNILPWGQCYKTFFVRDLQIFALS
jgi:hypothetical protein